MKIVNPPGEDQIIPYTTTYDQKIIYTAITSGNESAFTEIVNNCFSKLLLVAFRVVGNQQTAEDIVQEAFLGLWKKRSEIKPDNLGGWLYRVVINSAYKHVKRESRKEQMLAFLQSGKQKYHTDVEERLMNKEGIANLYKILHRLPEKQQVVYHLSREKGLRRNEIACHLNMSPNTVKVHLFRALQFIKEHIAGTCIFILFFVFNNLFFRDGNTTARFRDLYNVQHTVNKDPTRKTVDQFVYSRSTSLMNIRVK